MMVSDAPGGGSKAHTFASPNCDYTLDKRMPPTEYEVTVKLPDDAPDSMTKSLRVRRFAKIVGILGIIGDVLRGGG
jgi:hypothetical protein